MFQAKTLIQQPLDWPDIKLDHLRVMTDGTGLFQHAAFSIPRYEDGYCLDDNARALLLMTSLEDAGAANRRETRALAIRYLAFVNHAYNADKGRFRNFLSFSRNWTEESGSEESHGRALWALGTRGGAAAEPGRGRASAASLFHAAFPAIQGFSEPARLGLRPIGDRRIPARLRGDRAVQAAGKDASPERLLGLYHRTQPAIGPGSRTRSPTATRGFPRRWSFREDGWGTRP